MVVKKPLLTAHHKKLTQAEKQAQKNRDLDEVFKQRKAKRKQREQAQGGGGLMGDLRHQMAMSNTDFHWVILWTYLLSPLDPLIFFLKQYRSYEDNKEIGISYAPIYELDDDGDIKHNDKGEPIILPEGEGEYPPLYQMDEKGNYQRVDLDDATRDIIRANGFIPKPSTKECVVMGLMNLQNDLSGPTNIPPKYKTLLGLEGGPAGHSAEDALFVNRPKAGK